MAWIRPTSHTANGWSSPESAYDGNTGTNASYEVSGTSWSPYLEMYLDTVECNEIRIYTSRQNTSVATVEFDIRQNSTWTNVYSGAPADGGASVTVVIDPVQTVDAIRVRFYADHGGGTRTAYIHDTELFEVTEATYDFDGGSGSITNTTVAGTGAKANDGDSYATLAIAPTGTGTKQADGENGSNVTITPAGTGQATETIEYNGGSGASITVSAIGQGQKSSAGGSWDSVTVTVTATGTKSHFDGSGTSIDTTASGEGRKSGNGASGAVVDISPAGNGQIDPTGASGGSGVVVQVVYDGAGMKSGRSPPAGATVEITAAGTGQKTEIQTATGGSGAVVIITAAGTGSSAELEAKSGGAGTDLHINADGAGYKAGSGGNGTTVLITAVSPAGIRKEYKVVVDIRELKAVVTMKRAQVTTTEVKRVVT